MHVLQRPATRPMHGLQARLCLSVHLMESTSHSMRFNLQAFVLICKPRLASPCPQSLACNPQRMAPLSRQPPACAPASPTSDANRLNLPCLHDGSHANSLLCMSRPRGRPGCRSHPAFPKDSSKGHIPQWRLCRPICIPSF